MLIPHVENQAYWRKDVRVYTNTTIAPPLLKSKGEDVR